MVSNENIIDECFQSQNEELNVIHSIYGDEWVVEPRGSTSASYHIVLTHDGVSITFQILLPPNYPIESPPIYTLSAPSLSKEQKNDISTQLEMVYLANLGQPVLFQWIEKVRECLSTLFTASEAIDNKVRVEHCSKEVKTEVPLDIPDITHGEIILDRKSTFQGHAAVVNSTEQVKDVLNVLKGNKKIANATHNMYAYRIQKPNTNLMVQDCEDDGECQAGSRMLHLLQILNVTNVLVVVSRWYGGILLSGDRFRHINNATRQVLVQAGLIDAGKKKS